MKCSQIRTHVIHRVHLERSAPKKGNIFSLFINRKQNAISREVGDLAEEPQCASSSAVGSWLTQPLGTSPLVEVPDALVAAFGAAVLCIVLGCI